MKLHGLALLLFSFIVVGQTTKWESEPILLKPVEVSEKLTLGVSSKYYNESAGPLTFNSFDAWIDRSSMRHFTPDQFILNSINEIGFNNEVVFGSVMSQQLNLGKVKLIQNYVFDVSGNLRNSILTIDLGNR